MKKIVLVFAFFLIPYGIFSQSFSAALPFLLDGPDARYSGIGMAGTALSDDIYAIHYNPAGLARLKKTKIKEGTVSPYFEVVNSYFGRPNNYKNDMFYLNSAACFSFGKAGTIGIDIIYNHIGEFTRTFEDGKAGGEYTSSEQSVGISYAKALSNEINVGVKLKYCQSDLTHLKYYTYDNWGLGYGVAFDLGFLWNPKITTFKYLKNDFLSFGINLQNIGPKVSYRNESEPMPTNLRLGLAVKAVSLEKHKVNIVFDAAKLLVKRDSLGSDPLPKSLISGWGNNAGMVYSGGAEYWYKRNLAARVGYFSEDRNSGNREYLSLGFSARFYIFQIDVARLIPTMNNNILDVITIFTLRVGG